MPTARRKPIVAFARRQAVLFPRATAYTLPTCKRSTTGTDMASSKASPSPAAAADEPAAYLDMTPERRAAAKAHAALLSRTADRVARELPMSADVDDFRRVLAQEAKP
jgi:hypothetical protein